MPCTMPPRTCSSTSSGLMTRPQSSTADRKSTRLNSSHTEIYTLSLHDALPILDAFLEQNRTDALHDAAAHLLIDQQRIDDSSAVVDRRSEEHTSELQSHRDLHSFPTRRSSDLRRIPRTEPHRCPARCRRAPAHRPAAD